MRRGCQGSKPSAACSGKRFGSPAAKYASTANIAACWWLPWLPSVAEGFIVTMTSGRVVVGINIVTAFAAPTPFNLGQVFIGSLWILPLAYFIRFVPLVFRNAAASLAQIDPSAEEAAQNLGAGPWRTLRTVTLPLMTRGVLAGALMAFVQGFGEYVASVVVYPARFAPLSVEIYNRQYAN